MIRQAHTYLVGAMGGATLIAVAIAVFVVLVSAQVFRDWPIAALGDGGESAAVSQAQPAGGSAVVGVTGSGAGSGAAVDRSKVRVDRTGAKAAGDDGSVAANGGVGSAGAGAVTPEQGGSGAAGGQGGGDGAGTVATPQSPSSSSPSGGGGSASAGSGSAGGKSTTGGTGGGNTSGAAPSPTGQVTETVNDTVAKVDETALGGTLGSSGVTGVTEGAVNGVVGPESTVGKVVDETVGAVDGLLGSKR